MADSVWGGISARHLAFRLLLFLDWYGKVPGKQPCEMLSRWAWGQLQGGGRVAVSQKAQGMLILCLLQEGVLLGGLEGASFEGATSSVQMLLDD